MSKLPTKKQILDWIKENPKKSNKREISKAFGIKGSMRIDLKRILKELALEGKLEKKKRSFEDPNQLSAVCVLQMMASTSDGDLFARPACRSGPGRLGHRLAHRTCPRFHSVRRGRRRRRGADTNGAGIRHGLGHARGRAASDLHRPQRQRRD